MGQKRKAGITLVAAATAVVIFSAAHSGSAGQLFSEDTILDITVHGPFSRLEKSPEAGTEVVGAIELEDGTRVPASISTYGISRLHVCSFVPLKLDLSSEAVAGTAFADLQTVRLIPPCQFDDEYEQYAALEYLVYRSYQILASPAIRVRPVNFKLQNTDRRRTFHKGFGYVVEDLNHTAARTGFTWLDVERQERDDFDAAQLTSFMLFQYMVGNTDWSVMRGSRGERCCHNVAVFGFESGGRNTLVPFDFDHAGLVNAPYASVDKRLGIRRVTERLYRGFCWHNDQLAESIEHFNSKRSELEVLFKRSDLPQPRARKRALRYLKSFYGTINDPQKVEKKLLQKCRE
jgi:hypothetical protein